jgi:hypothetical protein
MKRVVAATEKRENMSRLKVEMHGTEFYIGFIFKVTYCAVLFSPPASPGGNLRMPFFMRSF